MITRIEFNDGKQSAIVTVTLHEDESSTVNTEFIPSAKGNEMPSTYGAHYLAMLLVQTLVNP